MTRVPARMSSKFRGARMACGGSPGNKNEIGKSQGLLSAVVKGSQQR